MVVEGDQAPDFELPTAADAPVRLSRLRGRPVVVYFYPKDDTKGCTAEALAFTQQLPAIRALGGEVIGISPDSVASHKKFRAKYDLGLTLAADEERAVATAWGVWVEKSMYGRKYMGVERATFLLDRAGRVAKVWRKVKVPGHVEAVLSAMSALGP